MNWFIAEDIKYYQDLPKLQSHYGLSKIIILPEISHIREFSTHKKIGFIAPYHPPKDLFSLFVITYLPNKFGILTTQEKLSNISESKALESRLGLSVIDSPFTLQDIGGATLLKEWTNTFLRAEKSGYKAKAIFVVGVPGTGKTFFAKCFAGETKRLLIQLNLTQIMESEQPIIKLNQVFEYLTHCYAQNKQKYIILIDEIEKMIGNAEPIEKRIMGRLLTILNDMHTQASEYKFDAIFFATANNLDVILKNNPELLRRGRFDELFFINLPKIEQAKSVFEMYLKKNEILKEIIELLDIEDLLALIENEYQEFNSEANAFPYTSSEIETFCKNLKFYKQAFGNITKEHIENSIKLIIPIIKTAGTGIDKMLGQKNLFSEV